MEKIVRIAIAACAFAWAGLAIAQADEAPRPGPEHEKLGWFVGKWRQTGEVMENPLMAGGPMEWTERCEWFDGRFAVVCHSEGRGPTGPMKGLGILSYSKETGAYHYYGLDNAGMAMATVPRGTFDGERWVFHDASPIGGETVESRYTVARLSPTEQSFSWEVRGPDGTWTVLMEGKGRKR